MSPARKAPHDAARAPRMGAHELPPRDSVPSEMPAEKLPRWIPVRADLIERARLERGWTEAEAAEAIGIGHRNYQVWKRKGRDARARPNNVARAAAAFDIPLGELSPPRLGGPVPVLSEVERLELVEAQLRILATEIRRTRGQLTKLDSGMREQLEELSTSVTELLAAAVADLVARSESAPESSRSRTNG